MSIEAPRHISHPEIKPEVNGDLQITPSSTASPQQPPKKKIRYTEPPIWAQSVRSKNAVGGRGPAKVNGKQHVTALAPAPIPIKTETNGTHQIPAAARGPAPEPLDSEPSLLGQWEPSITGVKPNEELVRQIADFIYNNVVSRNDLGELSSHGVEIEIEAKLGQFIEMGDRVRWPVTTETIIAPGTQVQFRSAMTEVCTSPCHHLVY